MDKCVIFLFLASLVQLSSQDSGKNYVAAVVEFCQDSDFTGNIQSYNVLIDSAVMANRASIVIFPESTLTPKEEWASLVPDPKHKIIPHQNETYRKFEAIYQMSKTAAKYKVYLVINLKERENCTKGQPGCPERGYYIYNTNVAFDRNGMVVARYRKVNVYDENVNKPVGQDLSTFTTDYGVTYGLISGFDVLFKTPSVDLVEEKKVENIIFASHWVGELPFLTAVQVQGGWSYATNVTLFASGANNPYVGSTGSGFYFGRKSFISYMYELHGTAYYWWNMSKIPDMQSTQAVYLPQENEAPESRSLLLLKDPSIPWAENVTLDLEQSQLKKTLCHNGLCCKFDIDYVRVMENTTDSYSYKAVAFQGERPFGKSFRHEVAYCAVVLCIRGNCAEKPSNGDYPLLFNKLNIEAEFKTANTLQMPTTLTWNSNQRIRLLHLMKYDSFAFERKDSGKGNSLVTMQLKKRFTKNLITFGIFGRKFD